MKVSKSQLYSPRSELINNQILVINCGSSSIKASLFEYQENALHRLLDVHFKGINTEKNVLEITSLNGKETATTFAQTFNISEALQHIFHILVHNFQVSLTSLKAVGHRFVHGGSEYFTSAQIDAKVMANLEKLSELAPLHNEACLTGIKECLNVCKNVAEIVVFDTAFHHTLPAIAAHYAIPMELSEKYQIKRYGFHGISHAFLWDIYKKHIGKDYTKARIITLHLGNGCSMDAICGGVSVDTSMGFTPLEGLIMGTRVGDIDAAIVEFICQHENKTAKEVIELLNFHSGLLGISGLSSEVQTLLEAYHINERAKLAIDMFCYRIVKYLGAYIAVLGGVEAIIFSGGIGENSPIVREKIINKMSWFGIALNDVNNQGAAHLPLGTMQQIHDSNSSVSVFVAASDENFFIAQEAQLIVP